MTWEHTSTRCIQPHTTTRLYRGPADATTTLPVEGPSRTSYIPPPTPLQQRRGGASYEKALPPVTHAYHSVAFYVGQSHQHSWLWPLSPGPWWSTETAFWTRSSRLLAKIDEPWSIDHKIRVLVDEQSTGGLTIEALSRPDSATSSTSTRCATRT